MAGKQSKRGAIRSADVLRRLSCEGKHSRVSWSVCEGRQAQNALHEILVFVDDWLELSFNLSITFQKKKNFDFLRRPRRRRRNETTKTRSREVNTSITFDTPSSTHLNFCFGEIVGFGDGVHAIVVELRQRVTEKLEAAHPLGASQRRAVRVRIERLGCHHEVGEVLQM